MEREPFVTNRIVNQTHRFWVGLEKATGKYFLGKPAMDHGMVTADYREITEKDYLEMKNAPKMFIEKHLDYIGTSVA